jgi:hypothetical protein
MEISADQGEKAGHGKPLQGQKDPATGSILD